MRRWMIVASCTLPFAVLAQPDTGSAPAAPNTTAAAPAETAPAPAAAAAPAPAAPAASSGFGAQTRYWLATQASGANSVTEERSMPGEVASLVYQRYLNSFTHPIPERYETDTFTTKSGR